MPKKSQRQFDRLTQEQILWHPPEDLVIPDSTQGIEPEISIFGQERAHKALKLGLELYSYGYNIFVCGISGAGRGSTIKRVLEAVQPSCALPNDLCYVNNFDNADRPILLTLPRGQANQFRDAAQAAFGILREQIPALVNATGIDDSVTGLEADFRARAIAAEELFNTEITEAGFAVIQLQSGEMTVPDLAWVHNEQAIAMGELQALVEEEELTEKEALDVHEQYGKLRRQLIEFVASQQSLRGEFRTAVLELERHAVEIALQATTEELCREFHGDKIRKWLESSMAFILRYIDHFRAPQGGEGDQQTGGMDGPDMSIFDINVLLSQEGDGCPIIFENHPTHQNVFGSQEKISQAQGVTTTDFSRIKAGSMVRAQGGYLILNAADVLSEPGVWQHLKRTLRSDELIIQPPEAAQNSGMPVTTPEAIPLQVKIVLVGDAHLYAGLRENDPDFSKIFKIKAHFDTSVLATNENINAWINVIVRVLRDDDLPDLTRDGIIQVLRHSMRLAGQKERLSIRFATIADVLRESAYLARHSGSKQITADLIREAVNDKHLRGSLFEERLGRAIEEGDILIQTEGESIGEVNGLTVMHTGDVEFGKPARISCRTAVGKGGVVNIEREVEMSGSSHDKGMLVLTGFLSGRYAQKHALSLFASLCFEQSHSFIDGDSASSAEMYALLSSLAELPLRQDIAVTGAIDQFGRVQTIGGANEKIEGFFHTCETRGLTGNQGVLIPRQNINELMLCNEVATAIDEGRFHVWAIDTVDDGIEFLTGVAAGQRKACGKWETGTVNDRVQTRLNELSEFGDEES